MGLTIKFPKLTSYQQATYDWLADPFGTGKVAVIKSPRQRGKTAFCGVELISMALKHAGCTSYVFEPTLNLARKVFKSIEKSLLPTGMLVIDNSQLLELGLSNGSTISFRSTEQTSRGLTVTGLLVLDECAYLDEDIIYELLPLVNAHKAPIIITSTPFIKEGYYWNMWSLGLTDKNKSVKSFDWNGYPDSERFITAEQKALYKATMSPQKYRTEIDGEFLEDGGLLFNGIDNCVLAEEAEIDEIYIGIDFASGKGGDFTVLSALNKFGKQVVLERTNNLAPMAQVDWLAGIINNLASRGVIRAIQAEVNSLGVVYIDALRKQIVPHTILEWTTSNESKRKIVTQLQLAFEQEKIGIIGDYSQMNELRKYEMQINPKTKTVTYNGAAGSHDDCVMALAFAYDAYLSGGGGLGEIVFV